MSKPRTIYCCACDGYTQAELVTGAEIYRLRPDLASKKLWRCPTCRNAVGCHGHSSRPLGCIPTMELKQARQHIHALIDPHWKSGRVPRQKIYAYLTGVLGREYHTADLRSLDEARRVYVAARKWLNGDELRRSET